MRTVILISILLVGGCVLGTTRDEFHPAHQPEGANIRLKVRDEVTHQEQIVRGELLAMNDSTTVVLAQPGSSSARQVTLIDNRFVRSGRVDQYLNFRRLENVSERSKDRMRLMSRFPQGIDEDLWPRLLAVYGQDQPVHVPEASHALDRRDLEELNALLEAAKRSSSMYKDINLAIQAGYRQVGPDFPGMGEHWVNPRLVVRPVDIENPSVLSYVRHDGKPVLTGVAYAAMFEGGVVPDSLPFPKAWHAHTGTIDEETLHLNPPGDHGQEEQGPGLTMLHVWAWVDNPEWPLAQDNWAVPFVRLGLDPPDRVPPEAGKALYLPAGGVEYYMKLIQMAAHPSKEEEDAIRQILEGSAGATSQQLQAHKSGDLRIDDLVEASADLWINTWSKIAHSVSPETWLKLEPLSD